MEIGMWQRRSCGIEERIRPKEGKMSFCPKLKSIMYSNPKMLFWTHGLFFYKRNNDAVDAKTKTLRST